MSGSWWQIGLLWLACSFGGWMLGYLLSRAISRWAISRWRRTGPRYVPRRCLTKGHKWVPWGEYGKPLPPPPIEFCSRWRCMGARVTPEFAADHPVELVAEIEQVIDRNGALSQDRRR